MMEASCYEWWLLLGLVLRDSDSVTECIERAVQNKDSSLGIIIRLKDGLAALDTWAERNWFVCLFCLAPFYEKHTLMIKPKSFVHTCEISTGISSLNIFYIVKILILILVIVLVGLSFYILVIK